MSSPPLSEPLWVEGGPPPKAGLLLLHGRHMQVQSLAPFVPALGLPVRCVLPAGPVAHEDGTRSWWPVDMVKRQAELASSPVDLAERRPEGRPEARRVLAQAVDQLHARQPPGEPLLLAGFSQGGMLALDYLLHTGDARVSGLAVFSASRIALADWQPLLHRLAGLPVLLAHGRQDTHLSFEAGQALQALLQSAGAQVQWLPFSGGHELPLAVWRGLRRFVQSFVGHCEPPVV